MPSFAAGPRRGGAANFLARWCWDFTTEPRLEFIGSVGTGFDYAKQKEIYDSWKSCKQPESVFSKSPKLKETIEWVKPDLVARVKYGNWTDGGRLRAPVFLGMRTDVSPRRVYRAGRAPGSRTGVKKIRYERAGRSAATTTDRPRDPVEAIRARSKLQRKSRSRRVPDQQTTGLRSPTKSGETVLTSGVEKKFGKATSENLNVEVEGKVLRLTHLNKMYFPESGIRKRDLLAYYFRIGPLMLPFLKDRPMVSAALSKRNPEKAFFQKEAPESVAGLAGARDGAFRRTRPGYAVCDGQQSGSLILSDEFGLYRPQPVVEPQQSRRICPTTFSSIWIPRRERRLPRS